MIFYLSGTGNTKWAASILGQMTGERLIDITKVKEETAYFTPNTNERIGFCFPVHGWRPPLAFRRFLNKLRIDNPNNHYCYALCTAGDDIGETMDILKKDLAKHGIKLDSAFSLIMPESYVGLPFMDVDTKENEERKKVKAAKDLAIYGQFITERKVGMTYLTLGRWPRVNSRLLGGFFTKYLITDKHFRVVANKCIGCKTCAAVCPVNNIVPNNDNMPQWKHNNTCLTCFACYHHCPTHAIEFGIMTRNKGQYYFK